MAQSYYGKPKNTVKCTHCGRKFTKPVNHICNTVYRKRKHNFEYLTSN